jgi:Chaperone of endosialidase
MKKCVLFLLTFTLLTFNNRLAAQGTAFTYQGQLQYNGSAASGSYNLTFTLYATNNGGLSVAGPVTNDGVLVSNGLFTVLIDFGPGALSNGANWLELGVESNGAKAFTTLTPRQELTPAPYAIAAESASNLLGDLPVSQLSGTLLFAQLPGAVLTTNETNVTLGSLTVGGDLYLPAMSDIFSGGNTLLLADGVTSNFFAGPNAGNLTTSGPQNTALGDTALYNNTTGSQNTAVGVGALAFNTTGSGNVAEGYQALQNSTNDKNLVAIGYQALQNDNARNNGLTTDGNGHNTAIGYQALQADINGYGNTAVGNVALNHNTNGVLNAAFGDYALFYNTSGSYNTATGINGLYYNTTGSGNVADGSDALLYASTGSFNTAEGYLALESVTNSSYNTATGAWALSADFEIPFTTGSCNTADGAFALFSDTAGSNNVAVGYQALDNSTNGSDNTAIGFDAMFSGGGGSNNTAVGFESLASDDIGNNNTALGYFAGYQITGNSNIDIGNEGLSTDDNTIRIGSGQSQTFIAGINGATVTGANVVVDPDTGQLGVTTSSARFKDDIRSMDEASEVLLSLRPVTFHYKAGLDPKATPQFGLVAEEVDQVDPDLVLRDAQHQIFTVRYEAVNAMLLNEFLKQHRKVEQQSAEIEALKEKAAKVDALEKQLNELKQMVQLLAQKK